jgi:hypothetical protein
VKLASFRAGGKDRVGIVLDGAVTIEKIGTLANELIHV